MRPLDVTTVRDPHKGDLFVRAVVECPERAQHLDVHHRRGPFSYAGSTPEARYPLGRVVATW